MPPLRIAFIHPDLGIGGAERLVVDAALGLQSLGHSVDVYTSHHDKSHCFEETRDGTLSVRYIRPPFPRSLLGKFHILLAHARQLHLTSYLLAPWAPTYDVYFVDQLSTCIPLLRIIGGTRVVFYCHFPDKLLSDGTAFVEGMSLKKGSLLKRIYRFPMDWLEEFTTGQSDIILANSRFTARVFKAYLPSIPQDPKVVYPGINISMYETADGGIDMQDPDIGVIASPRPTLLSLNRFEIKKNVALAVKAFAQLRASSPSIHQNARLVLGGGYDPRLDENIECLTRLVFLVKNRSLSYNIVTPPSNSPDSFSFLLPDTIPADPDVLFVLNFTTAQRTYLLTSSSTIAMLYTPTNEHFGIVPVEAMICGLPVLACDSGGPVETVLSEPAKSRTGWSVKPEEDVWAKVLIQEICVMDEEARKALAARAKSRAKEVFGMQTMAKKLEETLREAEMMGPVEISRGWWLILVTLSGFLLSYLLSSWLLNR
ncbi:glycosyltransferase family 4 protein [Mycena floridula]|nr:glycosyltransferase family 4 protein [Mycena floridula]